MTTDPLIIWDEERAQRWLLASGDRERQLEPVSDALFAKADLRPGEHVLDVGCGTGPTTVRAARLVCTEAEEPRGSVVGADVSPTLIAAASRRLQPEGIDWVVADAQTHDFGSSVFDVVMSRMGVMFFADPAAAFANLAKACRPEGRLALAVWRRRDDSALFDVPYTEVLAILDRLGADYAEPPVDGGQFRLAAQAGAVSLLTAAGWDEVEVTTDDRPLYFGGPGDAAHVADAVLELRPTRMITENLPSEVRAEVRRHLVDWAVRRHDGAGVPLPGGFAIISALRAAAAS